MSELSLIERLRLRAEAYSIFGELHTLLTEAAAELSENQAILHTGCPTCDTTVASLITQDGCAGCEIQRLRAEIDRLRAIIDHGA